MKNVLIIGGLGFIGSSLSKGLSSIGYNVFIFDKPVIKNAPICESESTTVFYGSLSDLDYLESIIKAKDIHTVIHLASTLIPSSGLSSFLNDVDEIVKPTLALLPILAAMNVKMVYFSSGGTIYGEAFKKRCSETDSLAPISYYGVSKLYIEEAVRLEGRRSGLSFLIIRPSNPYGIGQDFLKGQGLIAFCLKSIVTQLPITIWGDGSVVRDYLYIDDLVQMVIKLMEKAEKNQIYNIGSGIGYSVNEVLQLVQEVVGELPIIHYASARSVDVPYLVLDVTKALLVCNIDPMSLREGVKLFYSQFYKSNYNK
jgi:UDP-glucose 4-epimerase